jgi:hypothetical protein
MARVNASSLKESSLPGAARDVEPGTLGAREAGVKASVVGLMA